MTPAPIKVYFGFVTAVMGATSGEGNCSSLTFDAQGHASWDPSDVARVQALSAANLPTCDTQVKAPVAGDPCEIWYMTDGKPKLFLKTHQIIFKDC